MLCKINPTIGGATDEKARAINFLRAIQAICTAAAGSTPSALSQTAPTASPAGTDIITEVISNTEAGGWTSSSSTNVVSNYSATAASPYQLDLYRDSGKAVYPYRKLSFRTNPTHLFNGQYTTYPYILVSHGFNTATDASGNYLLGTAQAMLAADGVTNSYRFDVNYTSTDTTTMDTRRNIRPQAGEFLVASTDRYFIILSGTAGNTFSGTMMYVGLRTTSLWEDQYDDNPPLASVAYDGTSNFAAGTGSNASMWTRTLQTTGVVNSNPAWYRITNEINNAQTSAPSSGTGNNQDPLTGFIGTSGAMNTLNHEYFWFGNQMQLPMLPHMWGSMRSRNRNNTTMAGPVTDSATGTFVPPAYPITFARNVQNSQNSGGTAIGLYKSLGGSDGFMQQYYTPGQTFLLNNEGYYSYAIGNDALYRDLFLVRKA
jgi:hypothetical protein